LTFKLFAMLITTRYMGYWSRTADAKPHLLQKSLWIQKRWTPACFCTLGRASGT